MEILMGFLGLVILILLPAYILMSVGLFRMAKNDGDELAFLAFIPGLNMYTLGKLIRYLRLGRYEIPYPAEWVLVGTTLIAPIFVGILSNVSLFAFTIVPLLCLAITIVSVVAIYNLYEIYAYDKITLYMVLSLFIPLAMNVIIFMIRNNYRVCDYDYDDDEFDDSVLDEYYYN